MFHVCHIKSMTVAQLCQECLWETWRIERWCNTSQHCSCWVGHLWVQSEEPIPPHTQLCLPPGRPAGPPTCCWKSQSALGPLSPQTTQHDSAAILLIKPHPGITFLPQLKDQEEDLTSLSKQSLLNGNPAYKQEHFIHQAQHLPCGFILKACQATGVLTGEVFGVLRHRNVFNLVDSSNVWH